MFYIHRMLGREILQDCRRVLFRNRLQQNRKNMGLKTIEPHGINAVAEDEWVEIDVKIDSGATETVVGRIPSTG